MGGRAPRYRSDGVWWGYEKKSVGVWRGLPAHFYTELKLWEALKLRRSILRHFGRVTFRFHFPKIQQIIICMIFVEPSGNVHGPQTNCFYLWRHQIALNKIEKYQFIFKEVFGIFPNLGNRKCWERRVPKNPWDPFNKFLNFNIVKKHEMEIGHCSIQLQELKQLFFVFN